ncbi:MAG: FkbM family methyltransferase [Candidatus Methylacidiphilaceae bacterium]
MRNAISSEASPPAVNSGLEEALPKQQEPLEPAPENAGLRRLGRAAFRVLSVIRSLFRTGRLPGVSKASLLLDWVRLFLMTRNGALEGKPLRLAKWRVPACQTASAFFLFEEIFLNQIYDFQTERHSPRIFDCGANIGLATLFFKLRYPESRIEAFEADPDLADLYESVVRENGLLGTRLHRCAVSGNDGVREFYRHACNMVGSLSPKRGGNRGSIRIPACRLSSFIGEQPVDFLKLDVEGAEMETVQELFASGSLGKIVEGVVEYHHNLGIDGSRLSEFLALWEQAGFTYTLWAGNPGADPSCFQDIIIRLRRNAR